MIRNVDDISCCLRSINPILLICKYRKTADIKPFCRTCYAFSLYICSLTNLLLIAIDNIADGYQQQVSK